MEICPVHERWIHVYVIEPYLKGCELINQAWMGHDRSLALNPLSLTDRVICWFCGMGLMITPLLNTIIWLAWQTFGNPEKLDDPFCPEIDLPPPTPQPVIAHRIHPVAEGSSPIEQFVYIE